MNLNFEQQKWRRLVLPCSHRNKYSQTLLGFYQYTFTNAISPQIDRPTFPIKESSSSQAPVFLLPYDLPLTPYQPDDEAFTIIQDAIIGRDETVLHETVNDVETANDVQTVNHSKPKNPFEMSEEELSKIQKADEKWQVDENEGDSDVYSEIEDDFKTPLDESDPGLLGKEEGGEVVPMETQEEAADTVEKSEEVTLESLDQLYYSSDVD